LTRTDHAGVPAECRRALAFAILAALALDAVPGNVPAATGASGARLIGSLTPGSPGNWARCTTWMAQQTGMSYRLAS
jgi:anhydro-N-acetylmuramic acid kinase